jgi:hypothetical protein
MDAVVSKYRVKMKLQANDPALVGNQALLSDIIRTQNTNEDDFGLNYILRPLTLKMHMERKTVFPMKIDVTLQLNQLGLTFTHD